MHNFKNLQAWSDAMELAQEVHRLLEHLPYEERFGLRSQLSRCAVSVPSNIAEGSAKESNKDFQRFISYAIGSLFELETQLLLSGNLKLLEGSGLEAAISNTKVLQRRLVNFNKRLSNNLTTLPETLRGSWFVIPDSCFLVRCFPLKKLPIWKQQTKKPLKEVSS